MSDTTRLDELIEPSTGVGWDQTKIKMGFIYRTRILLAVKDESTTLGNHIAWGRASIDDRPLNYRIYRKFRRAIASVLGLQTKTNPVWALKSFSGKQTHIYIYSRDMEWPVMVKLHGHGEIVDNINKIEKLNMAV